MFFQKQANHSQAKSSEQNFFVHLPSGEDLLQQNATSIQFTESSE